MKFKFCADGDCPQWALAALHALGTLPAQLFRDLVKQVLEENTDDHIMEILNETSLASRGECARAAAAIRWVVSSSVACACPGPALARDLAVLGLPRAHAQALAAALEQAPCPQTDTFTVNRLTEVTASPAPHGTIDAYKLTLHSETIAGEQKRKDLLIEKTQARTLLHELKKACQKMEQMDARE